MCEREKRKKTKSLVFSSVVIFFLLQFGSFFVFASDKQQFARWKKECINKGIGLSCDKAATYKAQKQIGTKQFLKRPYPSVVALWKRGCQLKFSPSCLTLGRFYYFTWSNRQKALFYFRLGCKQSHARSCFHVATLLKEPASQILLKKQMFFYDKGCRLNHAKSCYYLSQRSRNREKYLKKSCHLGFGRACLEASLISKSSKVDEAVLYADLGCQRNNSDACKLSGHFSYQQHKGSVENIQKTMFYYQRSCQLKNAQGCYFFGTLILQNQQHKHFSAFTAFRRACRHGGGELCFSIASFYKERKDVLSRRNAIRFYKESCKKKYAPACKEMASSYRIQPHLQENIFFFLDFHKKSCEYSFRRNRTSCYVTFMGWVHHIPLYVMMSFLLIFLLCLFFYLRNEKQAFESRVSILLLSKPSSYLNLSFHSKALSCILSFLFMLCLFPVLYNVGAVPSFLTNNTGGPNWLADSILFLSIIAACYYFSIFVCSAIRRGAKTVMVLLVLFSALLLSVLVILNRMLVEPVLHLPILYLIFVNLVGLDIFMTVAITMEEETKHFRA